MLRTDSIGSLRELLYLQRKKGAKIGFVPTMGYLHEGHLSLVKLAKANSEFVVSSIFVNPTQFNDQKDLEKYPRDTERDCQLLKEIETDVVFLPSPEAIYPNNFQSWVDVNELTKGHCGASRPGHFRGVTTVVSILFNIVRPDIAIFGEKDFQQLRAIEQLVVDLKFETKIIRGPICREKDGLAMSSRNARLNSAARKVAPRIYESLKAGQALFLEGETNPKIIIEHVRGVLAESSDIKEDYIHIVDEQSLREVSRADRDSRILIAAFIDDIRLIDNLSLS